MLFLDRVQKRQQDHRSQNCCEQTEPEATTGDIKSDDAEQPSTKHTADDADDDVSEETLAGIFNLPSNPSCQATDDDPGDNS